MAKEITQFRSYGRRGILRRIHRDPLKVKPLAFLESIDTPVKPSRSATSHGGSQHEGGEILYNQWMLDNLRRGDKVVSRPLVYMASIHMLLTNAVAVSVSIAMTIDSRVSSENHCGGAFSCAVVHGRSTDRQRYWSCLAAMTSDGHLEKCF